MRQPVALFFLVLITFAALGLITAAPSKLALAHGQSPQFSATPLTDYLPGQLYLGTFPGFLYTASNNPPAQHDADGKMFASKVVPMRGKIAVIGIGMSNWTEELCADNPLPNRCLSNSFIAVATADPSVDPVLVLVDCAQSGAAANQWVDDSFGNYTTCNNRLAAAGVTPEQVEVILWKNADKQPTVSLSSTTVCSPTSPVDACMYEKFSGEMARFAKGWYTNTQQLFVHSRIYAGYANINLNPEPFAYENGFATKWLVNAQITQISTGQIDPTAGDLGYDVAPWIGWGPYFWASGTTPRNDGLTWLIGDYQTDGTHPGPSAITKVADQMMLWYFSSAYTPWFRALGTSGPTRR
jgi:hypothetical protein